MKKVDPLTKEITLTETEYMEIKIPNINDTWWYFDSSNDVPSAVRITEITYSMIIGRDVNTNMPVAFEDSKKLFQTREALCEYYRKLFE